MWLIWSVIHKYNPFIYPSDISPPKINAFNQADDRNI